MHVILSKTLTQEKYLKNPKPTKIFRFSANLLRVLVFRFM